MQSHRETRQDYARVPPSSLLTSCLPVVMTTSYPGAGLLPLEAAGKAGRGGPTGTRGRSILKYTASGKCNYKPEEGQSLI